MKIEISHSTDTLLRYTSAVQHITALTEARESIFLKLVKSNTVQLCFAQHCADSVSGASKVINTEV